jgi:uncharacterized protein YjbJ (UPF0337 family)
MTINQDMVSGKWREIKGEVQKAWGKLTSDEIEETKGDVNAIAGLVQQKYGESKDQFEKKFSKITSQLRDAKGNSVRKIKKTMKQQH